MAHRDEGALAEKLYELVRQDHRLRSIDVAFQPASLTLHIGGPGSWVHAIDRVRLSGDLEGYAEEIVTEWEGRPTRGIIILPGEIQEVPPYLLDHENVLWPPIMPVKQPTESVKYFKPTDLHRRVRLIEENIYVFIPGDRDPDAVIQKHRARIRDWLEKNPR